MFSLRSAQSDRLSDVRASFRQSRKDLTDQDTTAGEGSSDGVRNFAFEPDGDTSNGGDLAEVMPKSVKKLINMFEGTEECSSSSNSAKSDLQHNKDYFPSSSGNGDREEDHTSPEMEVRTRERTARESGPVFSPDHLEPIPPVEIPALVFQPSTGITDEAKYRGKVDGCGGDSGLTTAVETGTEGETGEEEEEEEEAESRDDENMSMNGPGGNEIEEEFRTVLFKQDQVGVDVRTRVGALWETHKHNIRSILERAIGQGVDEPSTSSCSSLVSHHLQTTEPDGQECPVVVLSHVGKDHPCWMDLEINDFSDNDTSYSEDEVEVDDDDDDDDDDDEDGFVDPWAISKGRPTNHGGQMELYLQEVYAGNDADTNVGQHIFVEVETGGDSQVDVRNQNVARRRTMNQLRQELIAAAWDEPTMLQDILDDIERQARELGVVNDDDDDDEVDEILLEVTVECQVCFETKPLRPRACCEANFCDQCLAQHCGQRIQQGQIKIPCPSPRCSQMLSRRDVYGLVDQTLRARFDKFLVDANVDPSKKTCPKCSHVYTMELSSRRAAKGKDFCVTCAECNLQWCFRCHAPWHEGSSCKMFQRGDDMIKQWAKKKYNKGAANARRCPKCKAYIQKATGCNHMTCNQCQTDFCYQCGNKYRSVKFVGHHLSRFSILGCKYRYLPDNPARRRLIRGSIFALKVAAASTVILTVGFILLPVYGFYKLHKKMPTIKRRLRRH